MARRTSMRLATVALAMVTVTACGGSSGSGGTPIEAGSPFDTTTSTTSTPDTTITPNTTTTQRTERTTTTRATTNSSNVATTVAPQTSGSSPAPTVAATTTTVRPPPPPAPNTTVRPRPRVKLPTGGPRGPVDPPNTPAYRSLTEGGSGCQTLYDVIKARWGDPAAYDGNGNIVDPALTYVYRGAAAACLQRWAEAKADLDSFKALGATSFEDTCPEEPESGYCERCHQLVLQWLSGQVAAYKADPTYAPVYVAADSTSPSPCPAGSTTTTARP